MRITDEVERGRSISSDWILFFTYQSSSEWIIALLMWQVTKEKGGFFFKLCVCIWLIVCFVRGSLPVLYSNELLVGHLQLNKSCTLIYTST